MPRLKGRAGAYDAGAEKVLLLLRHTARLHVLGRHGTCRRTRSAKTGFGSGRSCAPRSQGAASWLVSSPLLKTLATLCALVPKGLVPASQLHLFDPQREGA